MLEAEVCVPPVATVLPGQVAGEGGEEVEEDVGDDRSKKTKNCFLRR